MNIRDFYSHLLGLSSPWTVGSVVSRDGTDRVDVYLDSEQTDRAPCIHCSRSLPVCDHPPVKTWRHLDTCGRITYLHASLPVVDCPEHGRQSPCPPWGDASSPVTLAFEQWVVDLLKNFGDARKAARFIGMSQAHVRHVLSRGKLESRTRVVDGERAANDSESPARTTPEPPARQLNIFDRTDMAFVNQGVQAFRELDLEKAVELFQRHRNLYPGGHDISARLNAAELLLRGFREAPADPSARPAHFCRLWDSFEDYLSSESKGRDTFAAEIEQAFFGRVVLEAERCFPPGSEPLLFSGDIPMGYILLRAGRYEEAIRSLQSAIPGNPHSAALYGYLGDAYGLRGEAQVARQCYREACLIDPAGIDWRHLRDKDLKELKQELLLEYGLDPDLAIEWLPSHARIVGLFERKAVRVHDGLKELVDDYTALTKTSSKDKSARLSAKLFFRGIILCENHENLRFIKTIDLIQVRRAMKAANPDLFAEFLKTIVEGKG